MGKAREFKALRQAALAFMLVLTIICGSKGAMVKAADMTTVQGNTDVTDSLESWDDVKYYKFTISTTGYFTISLKKIDPTADVGDGWELGLYDMEGNQLRDYGDISTSMTTEKFPFKKGNQYYLKIQRDSSWSYIENVDYSLRINMVSDGSWEVEDNSTYSSANAIKSGAVKNATLWYSGDEDYYKYVVDKTGYFTVTFGKKDPTVNVGEGYHMYMYNSNHELLDEYSYIKTSLTTQKYSFPKGTVVYVNITGQNSWANIEGVDYSVKITSVARSDWEIETNKSGNDSWPARIKGVKTLGSKNTYGSLYTDDDNDVYKVVSPAAGTMNLTFVPNDVDTNLGDGYNVEIFSASGKSLTSTGSVKGRMSVKLKVKAGTYYVVIKRQNSWSRISEKEYAIRVTVPKKVTVPSIKKFSVRAGKKAAAVSWTKASGVSGYQVQYSRNKNFKNSKLVSVSSSKKSYTAKKLRSKSRYYVRVRAYKKVGGKVVAGKFTAAKSVVVK